MVESPQQQPESTPPPVSEWSARRPTKRSPEDYVALREKYAPYTKGNEFLTIPEALDSVTTRTISLTTDMVTRRLIGVGTETMDETLKSLQIRSKILA